MICAPVFDMNGCIAGDARKGKPPLAADTENPAGTNRQGFRNAIKKGLSQISLCDVTIRETRP